MTDKHYHYPVKRHFYIRPEDLPDWITEDPGPEKERPKHKGDTKTLMRKATDGIISEDLSNLQIGSIIHQEQGFEERQLDAPERIITDCIADKLMKKNDCYYLREGDDWRSQEAPLGDFPFLLEDMVFKGKSNILHSPGPGRMEEGSKFLGIVVHLNTKEIRDMIGLQIPCWKISRWIWSFYEKAYFIRVNKIYYKGKHKEIPFEKQKSPIRFLDLRSREIGKISRRKGITKKHTELEEFAFLLITEKSLFFLRSLLMKKFTIFPKSFYRLKWSHQDFIRYLSSWKGHSWEKLHKRHTIVDVKNLLKLKTKDVNGLKKSIKRILDDLMKRGFIKRWKAYGRGWDTEYKIQVKFERELFLEGAEK